MVMAVGDVSVAPVVDVEAGDVIQAVLPDASRERVAGEAWLVPAYADADGRLIAPVQAFLVTTPHGTVLVDGGVGDGKRRTEFPQWDGLRTGFLDRLRAAGAAPADVSLVVCTHLHVDHVGWNTSWRDGRWQPTFPNAAYVFVEDEYEHWRDRRPSLAGDVAAAFEDSVAPVVAAGRARLVPRGAEVLPGLRLVPTPGHTPAHASLEIASGGARALISGDLLHHPCQLAHPDWASSADADPAQAVRTRRRVLAELARSGTVLVGSHFAGPAAGTVVARGDAFALVPLAQ